MAESLESLFSPLLVNIVLEILTTLIRQAKEIKACTSKKKKSNCPILQWHDGIHRKISRKQTKNSKVSQVCSIPNPHIKKLYCYILAKNSEN